MTDQDVTLAEVYRAVQAVDKRLAKSVEDREQSEHAFRNRLEASNLKVAVLDARLTAAEKTIGDIERAPKETTNADPAARWTGLSAGLTAAGALIWQWLHKGG